MNLIHLTGALRRSISCASIELGNVFGLGEIIVYGENDFSKKYATNSDVVCLDGARLSDDILVTYAHGRLSILDSDFEVMHVLMPDASNAVAAYYSGRENQVTALTSDSHVKQFDLKNNVWSLVGDVVLPGSVRKLAVGAEHWIALLEDGRVFSFGSNSRGQLGRDVLAGSDSAKDVGVVEALDGIKVVDVSAGFWHSAALSEFGDLYSWGWNESGQLGVDPKIRSVSTLPLVCDHPFSDVTKIACGARHTVAVDVDGRVFGFGFNRYGQLGSTQEEEGARSEDFVSFRPCEWILDKDNKYKITHLFAKHWLSGCVCAVA